MIRAQAAGVGVLCVCILYSECGPPPLTLYRSLSPAGNRVLVQGEVSPSELKAIEGSCACC